MPITEILEKNARLYRDEVALVEINPSLPDEKKLTWREYSLIEASKNDPFHTKITRGEFDKKATASQIFCYLAASRRAISPM